MIPIESFPWEPACAETLLEDNILEIWRVPVESAAQAGQITGLASEEQARAECMNSPVRRAQYIAGHVLANRLRSHHGAPLFTSLSHSGEWVVVAAARNGPVGVDMECLRTERPLKQLSRRFFPPEEDAWLAQFPLEEQSHVFYWLWTAKEALFKALGMPADAAHFAARRVFASFGSLSLPQDLIVGNHKVGWFCAAPGYLGAYAAPLNISRTHFLRPE